MKIPRPAPIRVSIMLSPVVLPARPIRVSSLSRCSVRHVSVAQDHRRCVPCLSNQTGPPEKAAENGQRFGRIGQTRIHGKAMRCRHFRNPSMIMFGFFEMCTGFELLKPDGEIPVTGTRSGHPGDSAERGGSSRRLHEDSRHVGPSEALKGLNLLDRGDH